MKLGDNPKIKRCFEVFNIALQEVYDAAAREVYKEAQKNGAGELWTDRGGDEHFRWYTYEERTRP